MRPRKLRNTRSQLYTERPMSTHSNVIYFQAELRSPVAFDRTKALHSLELMGEQLLDKALAKEVLDFTSRGVPFYALEDSHFNAWVGQAGGLWTRARTAEAQPA